MVRPHVESVSTGYGGGVSDEQPADVSVLAPVWQRELQREGLAGPRMVGRVAVWLAAHPADPSPERSGDACLSRPRGDDCECSCSGARIRSTCHHAADSGTITTGQPSGSRVRLPEPDRSVSRNSVWRTALECVGLHETESAVVAGFKSCHPIVFDRSRYECSRPDRSHR